ncbi:hypothetical protein HPB47_006122, partial [Ixodes persulcatus]
YTVWISAFRASAGCGTPPSLRYVHIREQQHYNSWTTFSVQFRLGANPGQQNSGTFGVFIDILLLGDRQHGHQKLHWGMEHSHQRNVRKNMFVVKHGNGRSIKATNP